MWRMGMRLLLAWRVTLSPVPPLLLAMAVLANAQETDKDTLDGMDAEVRGEWVEAAQAFGRAAAAAPGDTRRALRLRYARQRAMAIWKPQLELLLKEKRLDDAGRAVSVASLIDPNDATVLSVLRRLEKAGVKAAEPPGDEPVSPLFPGRSAAGRLRCWSTVGPAFGKASRIIDDGTKYLLATQDANGSWDADKHGGQPLFDVGVTALALLALLADGPGGLAGDRGKGARLAVDWLLESQDADGVFGTRKTHSFMYNTTIATEALAEYAAITGETERLREKLERSRDFIVGAQNRGAGWRYDPQGNESDTSVTSRAVTALVRLRVVGINVDGSVFTDAQAWVDSMVEPNFGQIGYNYPGGQPARPEGKQDLFPGDQSQSMTAAGILATCYTGVERTWMQLSLALLSEVPPQSRYADMYYWQVGSRAWVAASGRVPVAWYEALVDAASKCGKPDGGMAACDVWGSDGGRIYGTAMTVLALAAPYSEPAPKGAKSHPASDFLRNGSKEVSVPAWLPEAATGIYAEPGMKITVTVTGTIEPWEGAPGTSAAGTKPASKSYKPLLKGEPFACLLGRIGPEGKLFRIPEEKPLTLGAHGQLFLLANDERAEDGDGTWDVRIRLQP